MNETALVLSGGGVRGAYQVGVLRGIVEVLGLSETDSCPFSFFAGTSIGALNIGYVTAHAHRGDMGVRELSAVWSGLRMEDVVKTRPLGLLRSVVRGVAPTLEGNNSLVDPDAMKFLVDNDDWWEQLHKNVDTGVAKGIFIATLEVATGRTSVFADVAPGVDYVPSGDPRRISRRTRLLPEHLMASAAIPVLLPARKIDGGLYVDGGLRFNTPISPVLRAGADRVMVVSMIDRMRPPPPEEVDPANEQSLLFLAGKLISAALLDPLEYDLAILDRINALMGALESVLDDQQLAQVRALMREKRGADYKKVRTLLFTPSQDIGLLVAGFIRDHKDRWKKGSTILHRVLRRTAAAQTEELEEADWASFILFDGPFCELLINLGHNDALARADEVRDFFA